MVIYRRALPEDLPAIRELINMVFSMSARPHDFKKLQPKVYADDALQHAEHYVAVEDGRIIANVGLLPDVMTVGGVTLRVGHVGNVSVHPYARHGGHMRACMQMMLTDAKDMGLQMLMLGGARQRYGYFGFTVGGVIAKFDIVRRNNIVHGMKNVDAAPYTFGDIEPYAEECTALYNAQPVHSARTAENFVQVAKTWEMTPRAIFKNGTFAGYMISSGDSISEMTLKDEADAEGIIKAFSADHEVVSLNIPVCNKQRVRTFGGIAQDLHLGTAHHMYNILDWEAVLGAHLALKAKLWRMPAGRLVIEVDGQTLALSVNGYSAEVTKTDDAPTLKLSHMEAQDLCLATVCPLDTDKMPALVEQWFPLPVTEFSVDGF